MQDENYPVLSGIEVSLALEQDGVLAYRFLPIAESSIRR